MKQKWLSNRIATAWNRLPLIIRAITTGFVVSSIGISTWALFLSGIPTPWSIVPMIGALWAYVKFFSGSWGSGSKKLSESMKARFRAFKLTSGVRRSGITAAVIFVIIVQSSFVITFRLFEFPTKEFTADYKLLDTMPIWVAWSILIMSSIVAGICEETGFRGYMQAPLEKRYGASIAIIITSICFMLIHLTHSWASAILPHIFFASVLLGILAYRTGSLVPGIIGHSILDIFDYSVWWTDITGGFHNQTIFKTGVDLHFIIWVLVFLLSLFLFLRLMGGLRTEKSRTTESTM